MSRLIRNLGSAVRLLSTCLLALKGTFALVQLGFSGIELFINRIESYFVLLAIGCSPGYCRIRMTSGLISVLDAGVTFGEDVPARPTMARAELRLEDY